AMRASAERAGSTNGDPPTALALGWFFEQWVHHTGVMDYELVLSHSAREADGRWVTTVVVKKRGEYAHPMPIGVMTASGWTFGYAELGTETSEVRIVTAQQPVD